MAAANPAPITTKETATRSTMSRLLTWYASDPLFASFTLLQVLSFLILGITLAIGYRLSVNQSRQVLRLGKDLADAKTKQAEAEGSLLQLQTRVQRQLMPRWALLTPLAGALQDKPKGTVEILYVPEDDEAFLTAVVLETELKGSAGWKLSKDLAPISGGDQIIPQFATAANFPLLMRVGGARGFTVVSKSLDVAWEGSAVGGLKTALVACGFEPKVAKDPRLADDAVRIVVGPKE